MPKYLIHEGTSLLTEVMFHSKMPQKCYTKHELAFTLSDKYEQMQKGNVLSGFSQDINILLFFHQEDKEGLQVPFKQTPTVLSLCCFFIKYDCPVAFLWPWHFLLEELCLEMKPVVWEGRVERSTVIPIPVCHYIALLFQLSSATNLAAWLHQATQSKCISHPEMESEWMTMLVSFVGRKKTKVAVFHNLDGLLKIVPLPGLDDPRQCCYSVSGSFCTPFSPPLKRVALLCWKDHLAKDFRRDRVGFS